MGSPVPINSKVLSSPKIIVRNGWGEGGLSRENYYPSRSFDYIKFNIWSIEE